jgi:hypothetical protein
VWFGTIDETTWDGTEGDVTWAATLTDADGEVLDEASTRYLLQPREAVASVL